MRGIVLSLVLLLTACGDDVAPTWAEGSALTLVSATAHGLTVAWPGARDDTATLTYALAVDGAAPVRLGGDLHEHTVDGLDEDSEHSLTLVAHDEAGNASRPLSLTARTLDATAPEFPSEATLSFASQTRDDGPTLVVRWPAAEDRGGVVAYRLQRDDAPLFEGDARTHELPRPTASTTFSLVAVDAASNESRALVGTWTPPTLPDSALLGVMPRGEIVDRVRSTIGTAAPPERDPPRGSGVADEGVVGLGRLGPSRGGLALPPTEPDVSEPIQRAR